MVKRNFVKDFCGLFEFVSDRMWIRFDNFVICNCGFCRFKNS